MALICLCCEDEIEPEKMFDGFCVDCQVEKGEMLHAKLLEFDLWDLTQKALKKIDEEKAPLSFPD